MGKHTDAVKPFAEFRAPWETEAGDEAEIDKAKLKRYIYNLVTDKAKAQDSREEASENVTRLEGELAEAKTEAASANGEEATRKIAKLERDLEAAKTKVSDLEKAQEISELRAEVLEGVDPKHAKHVVGETREELEASLKEIREDFGIPEPGEGGDEEDEEDEDDEPQIRTRPRTLRNPVDRSNEPAGGGEIDFDAAADSILGNRLFG